MDPPIETGWIRDVRRAAPVGAGDAKAIYSTVDDEGIVAERAREGEEIVRYLTPWAGSPEEARAWYRSELISALDYRTPEAMVMSGQASAVREYLDHLAQGGFA